MKKFFSLEYFYELKALFIVESIILILLVLLLNTPPNDKFLEPYNLFNIWAFILSIGIWGFCSWADTKKYFNFFTLLSTTSFYYFCFWFLFTFMPIK